MKCRKWSIPFRTVSRLLVLSISMMSAAMVTLMPLTAEAEEEHTDADADAEYQAKKEAYREKLKNDDVTTDDLLIGSWVSFYSFETDSFEQQLDQMANAGVNFNIFPRNFGSGMMFDAAYWDEVEAQYAKRNMVYLMNGGMNADLISIGAEYAAGKEHCVGYHVIDEPLRSALPNVGAMVRSYREADSTRYPFVNLFPSYVGTAGLGGTYREYLQAYVDAAGAENIEYLSHDFYALAAGSTNMNIFADMEDMRAVAYENGKLKTHAFPQSTAWNGMRMPNIDEMRWNAYAYLAYGFKALSWFNLVCPGSSDTEGEGFRDSLIYRDGTIRDETLFAEWGDLNWEIRGLSDALMNLDTVHAYHTRKQIPGVEYLPQDFFLTPERKIDFVVSYMEAKDGSEPYIMLFNKSWTKDLTAAFQIDFSYGIGTIEYLDPYTGEYIPMDISDGRLVDTFRPGEGKLYRLKSFDPSTVDRTELNAAISLVESLSQDAYSSESWQTVQAAYETALARRDGVFPQSMVTDAATQLMESVQALNPTGIDFAALDAVLADLGDIDLSSASDEVRTAVGEALIKGTSFARTGPVTQEDVDALVAELNQELNQVQEAMTTSAVTTPVETEPIVTQPAGTEPDGTETEAQDAGGCQSVLGAVGVCAVAAMGAVALRKGKKD